jgi:hypothetical protein
MKLELTGIFKGWWWDFGELLGCGICERSALCFISSNHTTIFDFLCADIIDIETKS